MIHLGEDDTNPRDDFGIPQGERSEIAPQGTHRFARGWYFYEASLVGRAAWRTIRLEDRDGAGGRSRDRRARPACSAYRPRAVIGFEDLLLRAGLQREMPDPITPNLRAAAGIKPPDQPDRPRPR